MTEALSRKKGILIFVYYSELAEDVGEAFYFMKRFTVCVKDVNNDEKDRDNIKALEMRS